MLKNSSLFGALLCCLLACNTDYNTVGIDLIATDQFESETQEFPVYASIDTLVDVQASQISIAHLGTYNFPGFGQSKGSITSQLTTFPNPTFGLLSQETEQEGDDDNPAIINENEQVTSVYLEIPFLYNQQDLDGDGVVDAFDADPTSSDSDSDGDGITDLLETQANTNPLDADSDGDGIPDGDDEDNTGYDNPANSYAIEHLYGDSSQPLSLKIVELTHYFSAYDPDNNFETSAIYYANRDYYEEGFVGRTLFDGEYLLDLEELLFYYDEDDEDTPDIDETQEVETRLSPRMRIPLDPAFFQEKLIDQEGREVLANQNNFNDHIKGIHLRMEDSDNPFYMLLNLAQARIIVNYTYDRYDDNETEEDTSDDAVISAEKSYAMNLNGVRINHMQAVHSEASILPEQKLGVKGGIGTRVSLRLFDRDSTTTVLEDFKSSQILLNEARLSFYVDPDFVANWTEGDYIAERLFLYTLDTNAPLLDYFSDSSSDPIQGFKYLHGGLLEYQDGRPYRYTFSITEHVSNLVRSSEEDGVENNTLGLVVSSDISNLNYRKGVIEGSSSEIDFPQAAIAEPLGTILVGPNPEPGLEEMRLRLEIIYTDFSN